ncbi:MAG TPA: 2-amino-4-hydroxy-6-hydroxymethyldihydropteridine diphosphokinase [Nitrospirota bacterium]|nr:2-amino-4-hydroxy-6-hydroxymethyldihydropteridine diphosphokinase [Nitrospirota bacterium]
MAANVLINAFIGIGTNLGDRKNHIAEAIQLLENNTDIKIIRSSALYVTEPIGYVGQDWFLNCVIEVMTNLPPHELLARCLEIEDKMGRTRTMQWGPRVIDLDILLYNNAVIEDDDLIIPHPNMDKRRFVLAPLVEIAPDVIHPKLNKTVTDLLKHLNDKHKVDVYREC